MEKQRLEVFVQLAQQQQMTRVAERLNVKQPTVTFHIKKLEEEVGMPLFQRNHKRYILTEAGRALVHYAQKILALHEETMRVLQEYQECKTGRLEVGASHVPAAYMLPKLFGDFLSQYDQVELALQVKTAPFILERIKHHDLDFGLILAKEVDDKELYVIPLAAEHLVLVFHAEHPFAQAEEITKEMLEAEPIILHQESSTTRKMAERWAKENGVTLRTKMELGSAEAIKEAVENNIGYSLISQTAVQREVTLGRLITHPLPGEVEPYFFYLIYHRDRLQTPLFQRFLTFIQEQFSRAR
jgi:DNA-binding transcriptional LysR family regulator